ncbi:DUF4145 domain-containing protein [Burkholderia cenocepacia]|uniref:DUF4145 domain-containing protein n=1 Tax=Burkholderia cenocepacia TaxID=95486 RepID=UPI001B959A46|nr:DUF4145 domain-containing protein [Burkholderia cenocepacia]MBR8401484.1 DUF4145 domain-containing protein [Burkholderia cenocepacia]
MTSVNYIPPTLLEKAFNCANCGVFAKQAWFYLHGASQKNGFGTQYQREDFTISHCEHCDAPTIWHKDALIFPLHSTAEPPNADLPAEIRADFEEARAIANLSPRGAAALLRLAIQKLCAFLGQPGKNINTDIGALVAGGLPAKVQQALDSVRVIGNDAVHPGTIDLRDDRDTVLKLFRLVNYIAYKTISEPKEIDEIYGGLPADKLSGISQRDAK